MMSSDIVFEPGDRVMTPCGPGTVVYYRMKPPSFDTVDAYSVKCDVNVSNPIYQGTIYRAEDVQPLIEKEIEQ